MITCKDMKGFCDQRKYRAKGPCICKNSGKCDMQRSIPDGKFPKQEKQSEESV